MGKTTLLNVFLNLTKQTAIKIDCRKFIPFGPSWRQMLEEISDQFTSIASKEKRLFQFLKNIKGINVHGVEIRFDWRSVKPFRVLDMLNEYAEKYGRIVILAFDEAKYLRMVRGYDHLIAYSLDNLAGIRIILTGSEVGLVYDFLGLEEPSKPLFGRRVKEVTLKPFTEEMSYDFLKRGLEQLKVRYQENVLVDAVSKLDGNAGWLTEFGWTYSKGEVINADSFMDKASKMALKELKELFSKTERYRYILKAIAKGYSSFSDIYRYVELESGPSSKSSVHSLLVNLEKMGYITKKENLYSIIDPVIIYGLKK
jgi:AAA+ ATPase superfamily predicted ATPase